MIERHEKTWGYEEWIVNNDLYCGKKLFLKMNHYCSKHYHKLKHETFYVINGVVQMFIIDQQKNEEIIFEMGVDDIYEVPPLTIHRFFGITNSTIIEFSTHHEDYDSYRIEPSGFTL